jgi:serpin B
MTNRQLGRAARWALALALLLAGTACAGKTQTKETRSDKERLVPRPPEADTKALVAGNSAFALDLYHRLRETEPGNLFYSPHSISLALAMTYAGARGETERQMAETLHFDLGQEKLHPAVNALDAELAARGADMDPDEGTRFQLNIANALWGQTGYEFLPTFLDLLAEHYGAGLRTLDFAADTEGARQTINKWVSDQTEERIKDLIREGVLWPSTRLVLTNAIYFYGAWHHPFEEAVTRDGTFVLLDGAQVEVPMMRQTEYFPFAEGAGYQAIELPYVGRQVSMIILLPDQGQFLAFEETLDAERLDAILSGLEHENVSLVMPKFEYEASLGLGDTLVAMGMPAAFDAGQADFSGMTGSRSLAIGAVVHQAFVSVDEEGTEAAAATAVVMIESARPEPAVEVTVDRPFIFLIRDVPTGTILFVGRVLDPT